MSHSVKIPFQTFIAEGVNGEANFSYNNFTLFNSLDWAIEVHALSIINLTKEIDCVAKLYSPNINQVSHNTDFTRIDETAISLFRFKSENKAFHLKHFPSLAFPLSLKNGSINFKIQILNEDKLKDGLCRIHASLHRI